MLNISLKELKEKEYLNVERNAWDIANRLRMSVSDSSSNIICAAYVAYLVKEKGIEKYEVLVEFIEKNFIEEQRLFIRDNLKECMQAVLDIANNYSKEALAAVVLWQSTSGRFGAEFETPDSVVKLAVSILGPENGEKIADLCSGSGCFLTEVAASNIDCSLYGIEINTYSKEISAIRLGLISNMVEIQQGSVFGLHADRKFNKIFCDYPWNLRTRNSWMEKDALKDLEEQFPDLKRSTIADWHFILNTVNHLEEGGKAVVITTNGTAWNGGVSRVIREQILKAGYIEAVVSLPANLYPMTSIPTTLLVLSRGNQRVRMIDASSMATMGRRQNVLADDNIARICQLLEEDADNSRIASMEEIADNDFAINPSRFLETEVVVEDGVQFDTVIKNITRGAQIKASDLDELVSDVPTEYQYLMLANIQDGMISDDLPYIKELDKKNEKYCIKNNSLVISKNGAPVKIAVASVGEGKKILANGNLYVIEIDETKVNPYFIKAYLESEKGTVALTRITVGAALPNIPVDSLKKLLIPLPSLEKQNELAERYQAKLDELKVLKYRISKVTNELKTIYEEG